MLVLADFRGGESVTLGEHGHTSLAEYLGYGSTGRFFSRLFNLVVTAFGLGGLAVLVLVLAGETSGWMTPVGAAFGVILWYLGLYHFAGWRSMRRHRKTPRRRR